MRPCGANATEFTDRVCPVRAPGYRVAPEELDERLLGFGCWIQAVSGLGESSVMVGSTRLSLRAWLSRYWAVTRRLLLFGDVELYHGDSGGAECEHEQDCESTVMRQRTNRSRWMLA